MFKNHLRLSAAVLALSLAFLARASAQTADFHPSGTWTGSYQNSKGHKQDASRITLQWDEENGWTGEWDGYPIEDMTVAGDTAHWQHHDLDGRYYDVTATLVGGELRVLYVLHERPPTFCGAIVGPGDELYHGEGVFRLKE
jgi:hypothetical protein